MRVAVIDVGANTARLLVAQSTSAGLRRVCEDRVPLGLGAQIETTGMISKDKLEEVAEAVARLVATAYAKRAQQNEVLVTSPGRQSRNGAALKAAIARSSDAPVRLLSAQEEGALAFIGAVASLEIETERVAVCDVGGGSAQIAVGPPGGHPDWIRSIDLGSLRLTRRRFANDPPTRDELAVAQADVRSALADVSPPTTEVALATGGTARALRKLVGATLGPSELQRAVEIVTVRQASEVARQFGVAAWRAGLLPAGALLLAEIQRSVGQPLIVADGGVREGAALQLLVSVAAAA